MATISDISQVDSIDALRGLPNVNNPALVAFVHGYYFPGDGGGGFFRFNSGDTRKDDSGMVIVSHSGNGCWLRIPTVLAAYSVPEFVESTYCGAYSVREFGAKACKRDHTGKTDYRDAAATAPLNGPAFQAAIDAAVACNGQVYVPPGEYFLDRSLHINGPIKLHGTRMGSVLDFAFMSRDTSPFGPAAISVCEGNLGQNHVGAFRGLVIEGLFLRGLSGGNNPTFDTLTSGGISNVEAILQSLGDSESSDTPFATGISIYTDVPEDVGTKSPMDGCVFRDLEISMFRVGLHARHTECCLFDMIKISACQVVAILTDSVNNVDFHRCSLGIGLAGIIHQICYGVNYTSCDFEYITTAYTPSFNDNLPLRNHPNDPAHLDPPNPNNNAYDLGIPLTLTSSIVSVTNPYFEGNGSYLADVGRTDEGDAGHFPSRLIISGGVFNQQSDWEFGTAKSLFK